MKKALSFIFFLLLTLISCRYFFHNGVPVTHDGNNHLIRFANYKVAVRELQIPPRLAPNLVNRYGYPVFDFNYPLANIMSLPFSILGFSYEFSFKFIFIFAVFMAFWGANLFLREKGFSRKSRIFSLLVFALNPYIVTSIIYRGNIGEVMAWGILPWIFYFLNKIKQSQKILEPNFFLLTVFLMALFLAHNISAFFACILIFFYLLFSFAKDFKAWKKFLLSFIWSFAMALWFWLPAIAEKNLITLDGVDLTVNYYKHFPSLSQLLRLPIHFGYSYPGYVDSMSLGLGALQLILSISAIVYLFKNKAKKNLVFFIALLVLFLGQLSISRPLYDLIPFADFIQFPWRLALLFSIVLLPIAALIFDKSNKVWKSLLVVILLLQLAQFLSLKPIDYRHKNDIDYEADGDTTSVNRENMPKTFVYDHFSEAHEPILILRGNGSINVQDFFGSYRHYSLDLQEKSVIVESTAYFAGWETTANGQKIQYIDDKEIGGRIAYELEAGHYEIASRFTQNTPSRLIGNSVSAVALFVFALFILFSWQKDRRNKVRRK